MHKMFSIITFVWFLLVSLSIFVDGQNKNVVELTYDNVSVPFTTIEPFLGGPFTVELKNVVLEPNQRIDIHFASTQAASFPQIKSLFHLSIQQKDQVMLRDSYHVHCPHCLNVYDIGEKTLPSTANFPKVGVPFQVKLICDGQQVTGLVDGQQLFTFKHRASPQTINMFNVNGGPAVREGGAKVGQIVFQRFSYF